MNRKINNKLKNQYYRQIAKQLPFIGKQRRDFLGTLKQRMEEYLTDYPNTSLEDLQNQFGTPDAIADSFLQNTSTSTIVKRLHLWQRMLVTLVVALIVMFAIQCCTILHLMNKNNTKIGRGYYITTITDISTGETKTGAIHPVD